MFISVIFYFFGKYTIVITGNLYDYAKLLKTKLKDHNYFLTAVVHQSFHYFCIIRHRFLGVFSNLMSNLHSNEGSNCFYALSRRVNKIWLRTITFSLITY